MKITGFTIIRNAIKYDYPVVEAITSILPICDEFVVAVGNSEDGTLALIKSINSNKILYPDENNHIDHEVVIKYVPFVQDSKRALDEYSSTIFMNGVNTISTYNICEDSLLATPLMIDMVVLGELFTRMTIDE